MKLEPGSRLAHYEVVELIGKGGMGEVYRAKDTRLPREVAIKISVERFNERFAREAKVIASLNHPNICTLFDVGPDYLVMELVEGPTLSDRIKEGPLDLKESTAIAQQMAEALDYAHEKGVVHRDLKPGNVKIRPDGVVKVLDFGLAKVGGVPLASDESPTLTMGGTEAGLVLGTAAYMSPEQARGKPVDKRADVWAFGVVFYEMLTGTCMHRGESMPDIIASVLKGEPHLEKVPPQAWKLLRRCLEKDPNKRLRHIGDVMALLEETGPDSGPTRAADEACRPSFSLVSVAAVVALLVIAGAALALWAPWRGAEPQQAIRFEIASTNQVKLITGSTPSISPNGKWVVFQAAGPDNITRMYLRSLDSPEVRPLAGTDSANGLPPPVFWSPDSRSIAFGLTPAPFAPGQLKKLEIAGGLPQTITDIPASVTGGTWNAEGVIVFAPNNSPLGLMKVPAAGGKAVSVTAFRAERQERAHRFPQFLPDGRHFLYYRQSSSPEYSGIYVGSLDVEPGQQSLKPLMLADRQAYYAANPNGGSGHLLFLRDTTLFAQSFDTDRLELTGDPVPIANQVGSFDPARAGLYSVSQSGSLAYRTGVGGTRMQLTWLDPTGKVIGTLGELGSYAAAVISPDGTRVAVSLENFLRGESNLWILHVDRGTATQFTFSAGINTDPVWSPDGRRIVFSSNRLGHLDLYEKPSDGSGEERLLLKTDQEKFASSWSRDGYLLYTSYDPKNLRDIWALPMGGDGKPFPILQTQFNEAGARVSPDGRWLAYQSNESGVLAVYVRTFAPKDVNRESAAGKWKISTEGGGGPRWRGDGRVIAYNSQGARMMRVDVDTTRSFQAGTPASLFPLGGVVFAPDMTSDGKRFLYGMFEGADVQTPHMIVLNWQAALRK